LRCPEGWPTLDKEVLVVLIAIEGIDGSGKGTQAELLSRRLQREGIAVKMLRFPQYEATLFGREVGRFLNGEFGALEEVPPKFSSLLYALDRFQALEAIASARDSGQYVICDRYTGSNMAHQAARVPDAERQAMREWIRKVEEEILGIPRPELVVFLETHVTQAQALIGRKDARSYTEKTHDLQEASAAHLEAALSNFRSLSAEYGWARVACVDSAGALRSAEAIGDEIYGLVVNAARRK
jgi:dTMP kinase